MELWVKFGWDCDISYFLILFYSLLLMSQSLMLNVLFPVCPTIDNCCKQFLCMVSEVVQSMRVVLPRGTAE